jgi:hypothetical protein
MLVVKHCTAKPPNRFLSDLHLSRCPAKQGPCDTRLVLQLTVPDKHFTPASASQNKHAMVHTSASVQNDRRHKVLYTYKKGQACPAYVASIPLKSEISGVPEGVSMSWTAPPGHLLSPGHRTKQVQDTEISLQETLLAPPDNVHRCPGGGQRT